MQLRRRQRIRILPMLIRSALLTALTVAQGLAFSCCTLLPLPPPTPAHRTLPSSASALLYQSPGGPDDLDEISNGDENPGLDDLSWRVNRQRLEEANTKRFLKAKPVKLPYKMSQRWIQMNWNPKTKEEFRDLVDNGNLRTPYISKDPERYYGERGEWM